MPTRRVTRCVSFALGLALGTGVAVLFSLLRTWFSASTPTAATGVLAHEHASGGMATVPQGGGGTRPVSGMDGVRILVPGSRIRARSAVAPGALKR